MLGHSLRRCHNSEPASPRVGVSHLLHHDTLPIVESMLAIAGDVGPTLNRPWVSIVLTGDVGPTLNRHWVSIVLTHSGHKHYMYLKIVNKIQITAQKYILGSFYKRYNHPHVLNVKALREEYSG